MSTLKDVAAEGYSPAARRRLAGGNRKFPHRLAFDLADVARIQVETARHMSISGMQDKISLKLERGNLVPADRDGQYILKPSPSSPGLLHRREVPANEHLTMQTASQVFGIRTAVNACVYLKDGQVAYITRRFDYRDGAKIAQEDFCQLTGRSPETVGRNFKYEGSYQEMGRVLRKYCNAYPVEIEKLFALIVFNYLFSNGDSHLKNFSLQESPHGDYVMSPAYDLICSSMHVSGESRTALELFDDFETESFRKNGFYRRDDFLKLAEFYGIQPPRANACIERFCSSREAVMNLTARSFLTQRAQRDYLERFEDRLRAVTA